MAIKNNIKEKLRNADNILQFILLCCNWIKDFTFLLLFFSTEGFLF